MTLTNLYLILTSPYLKRNQGSLRQAHTGFINKAIKLHLKVEVSYLKLFLILQSYYILKEAKQYYSHQIHVRIYQVTLNMYMMKLLRQKVDFDYDIKTVFKANITDRRKWRDKFRLPYLLGKADYIFVDDFHPLIYTVRFRPSQEIIQVWHAVGAFKTVGFSRTGKKVVRLLIH